MQATQLLQQAVHCRPDRLGTVYAGRARTWREIGARVARLAGGFRSHGIRDGDCVATLAMNSDRYLELFYAVPWSGAIFIPLNTRWAPAENAFALRDAGATVLFVDDDFLEQARKLKEQVPSVEILVYMGDGEVPVDTVSYEDLIDSHEPVTDADRRGDDLYVVFYTSGTTAQSKGVVLTHRNAVSVSVAFLATLPATDELTQLHVGAMFHLAGSGPTWYITLAAGTHVILPKFESKPVMAAIAEHRATNIVLVPTMINLLAHDPDLPSYDLSSLRTCVYGGSPMPEMVLRKATEKLPVCMFRQIYGMTETAGYATALRWRDHLDALDNNPDKLRSAGTSVPGVQVRIVRPDGTPADTGEIGEITIRGDNVMSGYFHNPEADEEILSRGWVHSGDAGYFDDHGHLFVADRVKDMIISGGENVYSVDVERALYQHPAVLECAVIGIPSTKWGEAVHAIVVLNTDASTTSDELIAHCRELIGGYKCPRSIEFRKEPLPTTPVGKVRKNALRDPYWLDQHQRI